MIESKGMVTDVKSKKQLKQNLNSNTARGDVNYSTMNLLVETGFHTYFYSTRFYFSGIY
jgi:glutamine phosphoribosylpyrophosphate amidotransferase